MRDAYCESDVPRALSMILSRGWRLYIMSFLENPLADLKQLMLDISQMSYFAKNLNKTPLIMQNWKKAHNHLFSLA